MSLTDDDKRWITETINGAVNGLATPESRLMAALEHLETSVVTEFHKWAGPVEMRAHTHSTAIRAADLDKLETRQ